MKSKPTHNLRFDLLSITGEVLFSAYYGRSYDDLAYDLNASREEISSTGVNDFIHLSKDPKDLEYCDDAVCVSGTILRQHLWRLTWEEA